MTYYDSAAIYVQSQATNKARVVAIDAIIDALMTSALTAASTGNVEEYMLNDGQTTIRTLYRNVEDVQRAIKSFEQLRVMYVNRVNGRVVRLVDHKNFFNGRR